MIIFVRTKHATEELAERLRARGFSAAAINGDVAQVQRERTIDQLRKGKLDILVATDVAARGLDVDRISHVINHDIPTDTESYVHRIGRTGRAGRSGAAISFVTPRENHLLRVDREDQPDHAGPDEPAVGRGRQRVPGREVHRGDQPTRWATPQLGTFRELVQAYEQEHDVPASDIAAAIAVLAQDGEPLLLEDLPEPLRPREASSVVPRRATWSRWRISVGKRHRVEPRQIVGALANEGGLQAGRLRPDRHQAELLAGRAAPGPLVRDARAARPTPASPGS